MSNRRWIGRGKLKKKAITIKKINRIKHTSPYRKSEEEAVSPFFPQRKKRFPGTSLNMVSQLNST